MNFFDALNAHLVWKLRLREYLDGHPSEPLEPAMVGREDCCELGRWISQEFDARKNLPEFMTVREQHAEFHRCAAEILQRVRAGDSEGAKQLLLDDYAHLSARVVRSITRLNRVLESEARGGVEVAA